MGPEVLAGAMRAGRLGLVLKPFSGAGQGRKYNSQHPAACSVVLGATRGWGGAGAEPGGLLRNWGPDSRQGVAIVMPGREDGNVTHFLG